ncbi:hypothetical protein BDD43_5099 [Mucilaginibacter gracilis]|uniref:Peptidase C39-like domain-containing protein n=1 Tax=Mucilaginibacter gracilis TaxID=423350 RepID=A0A495J771_9SPHI|nr:hypothetical protein [Mucilaginibacter gracilis]RKR84846.1 hypothetical protein BDD43_5099 [Mucilaginibacter gracilis]
MKKAIIVFLLTALVGFAFGQQVKRVDLEGSRLRDFYLKQNVENLWLAGNHINWETGEPDNPYATKNIKTHCSAFVASVCKQKGVYILRPPEHKTELLANAQYNWLSSADGYKQGWRQIQDSIYEKAQEFANKGFIVIAVYKNQNAKKPGHIALVMPIEKSIAYLFNEGPNLIQAGHINRNNVSLKEGFKNHISNWALAANEISFFYQKNHYL